MYCIKSEVSFDSAHFLKDHKSKCKNIHGHRWRVIAEIYANQLKDSGSDRGMVVDFSELKADLKQVSNRFDHSLIIEKGSLKEKTIINLEEEEFKLVFVDFRPTAEEFARYFFYQLKEKGYNVKLVEVYETPTNCAIYSEM